MDLQQKENAGRIQQTKQHLRKQTDINWGFSSKPCNRTESKEIPNPPPPGFICTSSPPHLVPPNITYQILFLCPNHTSIHWQSFFFPLSPDAGSRANMLTCTVCLPRYYQVLPAFQFSLDSSICRLSHLQVDLQSARGQSTPTRNLTLLHSRA